MRTRSPDVESSEGLSRNQANPGDIRVRQSSCVFSWTDCTRQETTHPFTNRITKTSNPIPSATGVPSRIDSSDTAAPRPMIATTQNWHAPQVRTLFVLDCAGEYSAMSSLAVAVSLATLQSTTSQSTGSNAVSTMSPRWASSQLYINDNLLLESSPSYVPSARCPTFNHRGGASA